MILSIENDLEDLEAYVKRDKVGDGEEFVCMQGLVGSIVRKDGSVEVRKDMSFNTNEPRQKIVLSKEHVLLICRFMKGLK